MRCHINSMVLFVVSTLVTEIQAECEEGCAEPTLLYEDLRCKPVYSSASDCCPKEYNCSHIYKRPEGTCHLKGKFYRTGEWVDHEDVADGNCQDPCRCWHNSEFDCPEVLDGCAEFWLGENKPECYYKYELNQCCASEQQCPPFDNVTQCVVNNIIYNEGVKFVPPNKKCTKCVCGEGFRGKYDAPFCRKINCSEEIRNSKDIDDFCAPFYRTAESCCPDWWICPTADITFRPATRPSLYPELRCKFGGMFLNIGAKIEREDEGIGKISCECRIPPFLTCGLGTISLETKKLEV